jgi:translation initiation factor IF-1
LSGQDFQTNQRCFIAKKNYRKPVDEIKLLAHIKRTIVTKDRATQKRKKQKSESLTYDELLEKVRNNDVYKEFMKLEPGEMKFYDCRNYVSGNADDLIKLMNRISNRMNCNKRRISALGDSVDVEIEKETPMLQIASAWT